MEREKKCPDMDSEHSCEFCLDVVSAWLPNKNFWLIRKFR